MAKDRHRQYPGQSRSPKKNRHAPSRTPAAPTRQHHRTHRESLRDLVQKDRDEDQPSQPVGNEKSRGDRNSVEEGMNHEPENDGVALMPMHKLIVVRLFPKVKVRRDRVLEKMNDQIAQQNQQPRRLTTQFNALRYH